MVLPRLEHTVAYVIAELGEMEREEFFRLKMVKSLKEKEAKEKQQEAEERKRARLESGEDDAHDAVQHMVDKTAGLVLTGGLEQRLDDDPDIVF